MSNPGMRLTADGMNVLAKGLCGQEIRFTKGQLGDGDFNYDSETVVTMSSLKSPKLDMPIVGKELHGDGVALIKTQLCNANLTTGFAAKEIGIFALDPDTQTEILYAYRNCGDEYSFIPGNQGVVQINVTKAYMVEIRDADNVTFNIDWSFAYVSQAQFENLFAHFIPIYEDYMIPNANIIAQILRGEYISSGDTDSDDGIPSSTEIENILNNNFSHTDIIETEYSLVPPTTAEIDDILNS